MIRMTTTTRTVWTTTLTWMYDFDDDADQHDHHNNSDEFEEDNPNLETMIQMISTSVTSLLITCWLLMIQVTIYTVTHTI